MALSKSDRDGLKFVLIDTIKLLSRNGIKFRNRVQIQGLLAFTVDDGDVFVVQMNDTIRSDVTLYDKRSSEGTLPKADGECSMPSSLNDTNTALKSQNCQTVISDPVICELSSEDDSNHTGEMPATNRDTRQWTSVKEEQKESVDFNDTSLMPSAQKINQPSDIKAVPAMKKNKNTNSNRNHTQTFYDYNNDSHQNFDYCATQVKRQSVNKKTNTYQKSPAAKYTANIKSEVENDVKGTMFANQVTEMEDQEDYGDVDYGDGGQMSEVYDDDKQFEGDMEGGNEWGSGMDYLGYDDQYQDDQNLDTDFGKYQEDSFSDESFKTTTFTPSSRRGQNVKLSICVCEYPECRKVFNHKRNLVRHQRQLHGPERRGQNVKLSICVCEYPECRKVFNHKRNLVRHQRQLHGALFGTSDQTCFCCGVCRKVFYAKCNLEKHKREAHGDVGV